MTTVRSALIQTTVLPDREAMVQKHLDLIAQAARRGAQIICLQELFCQVYFGAQQDPRWHRGAERIPGPTTERMQEAAREHGVVLVVPLHEEAQPGVYYNTAAVIDADGTLLGRYRKNHLPQQDGFQEKYYFRPGDLGYPVFDTQHAKIGVFIDYDRHFPEVGRLLALQGAEILYNPCTTVVSLSKYLWFFEQRAIAMANGVFVGTVNRVGLEPLHSGLFYGSSYLCDPFGEILAQGAEDREEIVTADLNLDRIRQARELWAFFRDRRPETYAGLSKT